MAAEGKVPRRLCYLKAGFVRILQLAGHELRLGLPGPEDGVVVWGRSPYAARGEAVAARRGVPVVRVEDAFLRSLRPGRMGDAPLGLLIDGLGVHFDASHPLTLERVLMRDPFDNSNLKTRARDGIARIQALDLTKYNIHRPEIAPPRAGYVLIIDQTRGDASIAHSGASAQTFAEMLVMAHEENPSARIVIKTHPETALGLRAGHFGPEHLSDRVSLCADPVSPWALLQGAVAVYTVSSLMGFEVVLAGHRPKVFGQPFYAGWGLTEDRNPPARRGRTLSRAQLFAGAMIVAPTWYDPCRDRLCSFEETVDQLEAETRARREDRVGYVGLGMRAWKRGRLQEVFGRETAMIFAKTVARAQAQAEKSGRKILVWAGKEPSELAAPGLALRVEDGFLRSRGLGADLVPPLSLVTDDLGIYYDPNRESRLEQLILSPLPPGGRDRAEALLARILAAGVTKYNLAADPLPDLGPGRRVLVVGQVEDDASIRLGAGQVCTNLGLLTAAAQANPGARLIFKPHPDVESGLRPGQIADQDLAGLADVVARRADPLSLIAACDEVWTMTSLLGFEALIRGKPVTCLGAPFYAGWGLTRDLGPVPDRRRRAADGHPLPRPDLLHLVHAALIGYPRYFDPISHRPCPPEVVVERLAKGEVACPGLGLRILSKLQGRLASQAHLWR
ncbi:MAG: capsular polysaccharide biosynthesis protein [Paracoccaceae bacterium]